MQAGWRMDRYDIVVHMITFIIVIIFIYIQMYTQIPDLATEKVLATLVELHRKNWKHFLSEDGPAGRAIGSVDFVNLIGAFLSHRGTPKSSIYGWIFHYKPSSYLGPPHFRKPSICS